MIEFFKNIYYYLQGSLRYKLFYSNYMSLIPKHVREQIEYRVSVMDPECYEQGQCKICGCKTIALQMANKSCPKPCYPPMMNRKEWKTFIK